MGARKKLSAEAIKEKNKQRFYARLNNCSISPRKVRLVADLIRGVDVIKASSVLQHSVKGASVYIEKLLWSAIHNFEQKSGEKWENAGLFVSEIYVDSGRSLKRVQPAPQGRAHRIRKRSNHVTLVLDKSVAS